WEVVPGAVMGEALAVANQKGGVGKTGVCINMGGALAAAGHRVLLVDLDPQGNLTRGLGLEQAMPPAPTLAAALSGGAANEQLIVTHSSGLCVIPASPDLFLAERVLINVHGREWRLHRVLAAVAGNFDYVLIDCPPSLGHLTDNALVAAGRALVPILPDGSSLAGVEMFTDQAETLAAGLGISIGIIGLVVMMLDETKAAQRAMEATGDLAIPVIGTVRRRTKVREAWDAGQTIEQFAPAGDAAEMFRVLAASVVEAVKA
ncbi:MAG: ParA family protein, partial [Actinomycetota bacterium]